MFVIKLLGLAAMAASTVVAQALSPQAGNLIVPGDVVVRHLNVPEVARRSYGETCEPSTTTVTVTLSCGPEGPSTMPPEEPTGVPDFPSSVVPSSPTTPPPAPVTSTVTSELPSAPPFISTSASTDPHSHGSTTGTPAPSKTTLSSPPASGTATPPPSESTDTSPPLSTPTGAATLNMDVGVFPLVVAGIALNAAMTLFV
ncbi:hypothetical protein CC78DRAFT_615305 [Lojkania enalia]|uniref:Uncharacterized protein n=1 Tax=Lojkania enalia TaxID=147567 RepID=A0A9P4N1L8_9PLEO|nr:hypothetical protein CC78DRAFT_615305 [Didymosphaeria enalia]